MNVKCKKLKAKPKPNFSKVGHEFYVLQAENKFNPGGYKVRGFAHCTCGWKGPMSWGTMSYGYRNWLVDHLNISNTTLNSLEDPYKCITVADYFN